MKTSIIDDKIVKFVEELTNRDSMKKDPTNDKEATDDMWVSFNTAIHITADIIVKYGQIPSNIPAAVATPLPPCPFNHTGYTCPRRQDITA